MKTMTGTPSDESRYVLISPCRNEAEYLHETFESVLGQTLLPSRWIIVDDGSTDDTAELLARYAAGREWITVISRPDRGHRSVGPGVVDAFYCGFRSIDTHDFDYLCKLDLDLRLPRRYFEILVERMGADPRIATCSGKAYVRENGRLANERHGDDTSLGMTKFYRMSCFTAIGGFVREVMWDGIDCHLCRMNGWIACSWDDPELRFIHLRPMGSSQQSIWTGRKRHGYGQYFMGTGPVYMAASALSRINQKPYLIGSVAMMWGWLHAALRHTPRFGDERFRTFLRAYQRNAMLRGKHRALAVRSGINPHFQVTRTKCF